MRNRINLLEQNEVELTDDELGAYLDAYIRRSARWQVPQNGSSLGQKEGNPYASSVFDTIKIAQKVYDDMVIESGDYRPMLAKAIRVVKFTPKYVQKVIDNAIDNGTLTINESVMGTIRNAASDLVESRMQDEDLREKQIQNLVRFISREKRG